MKCAWLLLGCVVAMVVLDNCEGLWRRRGKRIQICRRRRWWGRRCYRVRVWSAGQDKENPQNQPDSDNTQLDPKVCEYWEAKEKPRQCQVNSEVCQMNCTGCDHSGITCPDGSACPDNCCVCTDGIMLKKYIIKKGANIEAHVRQWMEQMGEDDEEEIEKAVSEFLDDGDATETDGPDQEPSDQDDNDKTDVDTQKKPSDSKQ